VSNGIDFFTVNRYDVVESQHVSLVAAFGSYWVDDMVRRDRRLWNLRAVWFSRACFFGLDRVAVLRDELDILLSNPEVPGTQDEYELRLLVAFCTAAIARGVRVLSIGPGEPRAS
jgi:hypothetical protein